MNCPACESEKIKVAARIGWAEAFGTRHYRGLCADCGTEQWWDTGSMQITPHLNSGPHSCPMHDTG